KSGLMHAVHILRNTPDIAIIELDEQDVIRHKLVRKIIAAYEKSENENSKN
ncbi:MAG: hypothetical protein RL062_147, partial [Bacteroidota bacterium]